MGEGREAGARCTVGHRGLGERDLRQRSQRLGAEIKAASGKLELPRDLLTNVREHGISELPIGIGHAVEAARLPLHHPDPFDRMLIAQARREGLTIVTRDPAFRAYDVPLLAA